MTSSDKIHIVFACDDNYAQHAGVAIVSLREQQKSGLPVHVHLLDGGISPVNLERLRELKDRHLEISIYKGNMEEYSQYLISTYISKAAYLRLSIEKLLPQEMNKIIYCDCDLIFMQPVDDLWNIDLKTHWLAAALDLNNQCRNDLGIDDLHQYFNSGVMLIDLKAWRTWRICEKVKDYLESNWEKIRYWDQDGLNAILYKDWLPLDKGWNTHTTDLIDKKLPPPHIIHFASELKPWFYKSLDPFQGEYIKYLRLSPWHDYKFPDKNIFVWVYRKILLCIPWSVFRVVSIFTWRLRNFVKELDRQIALKRLNRNQ